MVNVPARCAAWGRARGLVLAPDLSPGAIVWPLSWPDGLLAEAWVLPRFPWRVVAATVHLDRATFKRTALDHALWLRARVLELEHHQDRRPSWHGEDRLLVELAYPRVRRLRGDRPRFLRLAPHPRTVALSRARAFRTALAGGEP